MTSFFCRDILDALETFIAEVAMPGIPNRAPLTAAVFKKSLLVFMDDYGLMIKKTKVQKTDNYKLRKDEILGWVLQHKNVINHQNDWKDIYGFTEEIQHEIDFVQPNFWCQYSQDSPFKVQRKIALRTVNGKYTIDGNIFRIYDTSESFLKITEKIFEHSELEDILKDFFGIVL